MRITLCGSAKFEDEFKKWNKNLTLAGHVVYSLACYPSDCGGKNWYTIDEKAILDVMNMAKIDNSDGIVVLDINLYIGESTKREIIYAQYKGKEIFYASHLNTKNLLIPNFK